MSSYTSNNAEKIQKIRRIFTEENIVAALSILLFGWSIFFVVYYMDPYIFRLTHVGLVLILLYIRHKSPSRLRVLDYICIGLVIVGVAYPLLDIKSFMWRGYMRFEFPTVYDFIIGLIMVVLVIEAMRRSSGIWLPILCIFFIFYALYGSYFPPPFQIASHELERLITYMYMTLDGILGTTTDVCSTYVTIFVLYGFFLEAAGSGKFFIDLAFKAAGRGSSAAARVTVLTTAAVGGPQGSGTATTLSLCPVLWPILKKAGYPPEKAAGLIATGGYGAVISPPLMGAAAFLIMEYLGVSLLDVILMCTIPTVLFYVSMFWIAELEARTIGLKPIELEPITWRQILKESYHLASLIVLIALIALGRPPNTVALIAIVITIITSFLNKDKSVRLTPRNLLRAFVQAADGLLGVAPILIGAGVLIALFSVTGFGIKVADLIVSASMGNKLLALALAMFATIIIGLAMPITASFIICILVIAPAFVKLGIPAYVAYAFTFYSAVLSEVSPPVALAPTAAAGITGANPYKAMMESWRYSLRDFIVPFFFSFSPEGYNLLLIGKIDWGAFLLMFALSNVILLLLSFGQVGAIPLGRNLIRIGKIPRALIIIGSVLSGVSLSLTSSYFYIGLLITAIGIFLAILLHKVLKL
ncbi:MAG: TRAP transporter fused permease subunit [Thaumarchaeota archaeon]|jgi:TRAP transporter 4TM/12TM fusion protein|nr:TRAP transporter fused permease subunit [Candidatus Geocrenenecus arthurdayi]